ncbi:hypothetical protein F4780DRAFT_744764 [Xylariomycetidae sp. FL0641]|nr:hypothetical protein F4780DRAFT_744764 [Xylariomycetidae sp. FL0641]
MDESQCDALVNRVQELIDAVIKHGDVQATGSNDGLDFQSLTDRAKTTANKAEDAKARIDATVENLNTLNQALEAQVERLKSNGVFDLENYQRTIEKLKQSNFDLSSHLLMGQEETGTLDRFRNMSADHKTALLNLERQVVEQVLNQKIATLEAELSDRKRAARNEDLGILRDLRTAYPEEKEMDHYLRHQWPSVYNHGDSDELTDNMLKSMGALDLALVAIRHLYSYLPSNAKPKQKAHEGQSPVLELAWTDFQKSGNEIQSRARYEALQSLFDDTMPPDHRLSFCEIAESEMMHNSLLQIDELLLYDPSPFTCVASEWARVEYPCRSALAGMGLVEWDPSQTTLVEAVDSCFGILVDDEDASLKICWSSNDPMIIRVRVQVPEGAPVGQYRFMDINTFEMDDARVLEDEIGGMTFEQNSGRTERYNIIAVIRLRKDGNSEEDECIRLYTADGALVTPFGLHSHLQGEDWAFGEAGTGYMLYYSLCSSPPRYSRER